jgi:hypothetical protein
MSLESWSGRIPIASCGNLPLSKVPLFKSPRRIPRFPTGGPEVQSPSHLSRCEEPLLDPTLPRPPTVQRSLVFPSVFRPVGSSSLLLGRYIPFSEIDGSCRCHGRSHESPQPCPSVNLGPGAQLPPDDGLGGGAHAGGGRRREPTGRPACVRLQPLLRSRSGRFHSYHRREGPLGRGSTSPRPLRLGVCRSESVRHAPAAGRRNASGTGKRWPPHNPRRVRKEFRDDSDPGRGLGISGIPGIRNHGTRIASPTFDEILDKLFDEYFRAA